MQIKWSEKAILKLLKAQFIEVSKRSWIITWFMKLLNTKTGRKEFLSEFTKKQLINPDPELIALADALKSFRSFADTVYKVEKYVYQNWTYKSDDGEEWLTAIETFKKKFDDCEGQNNLIYVLCMLAGVPDYLLWMILGDTSNGYHCYCVFYHTQRMKLIPIDSTYNVEIGPLNTQKEFIVGSKYKYPDFVWNSEHTFKWKT